MGTPRVPSKKSAISAAAGCAVALALSAAPVPESPETSLRTQIAAASLADAVVVDCQLPGRLQQLGGMRTYLTPGALLRLPAIDCRTRGGEYTVGDLASGTLSLKRWLPLAEKDNVEAQYYVARIYANGMDNVPLDYAKAAEWYQRAVQHKYAPAMQELGYLYEQGLGVPKDALRGLNLQREASGLGEDLDYAAKIAANKEEFDRQLAGLTEQLDQANAAVQAARGERDGANDRLLQQGAELDRDRTRLVDLRAKLDAAMRGGSTESAAQITALRQQLAADEKALADKQEALGTLSAQLSVQQSQLSEQLARSQAANASLNQLLAVSRSENVDLRTRVAQSEQRLNESQQELSRLRATYLQNASELSVQSAQLEQLRAHDGMSAQALFDARKHELEQRDQQIRGLQNQMTLLQQQASSSGANAADSAARNRELQKTLDDLRLQSMQQQERLAADRAELARMSQSNDDRAALAAQLSSKMNEKVTALETAQQRLATLQLEVDQLRTLHERDVAAAGDTASRDKNALQASQDTIAAQQRALEQKEMDLAARQVDLVRARQELAEHSGNERAEQQKIGALESDLRSRDQQISALRAQLAKGAAPAAAAPATALVAANVRYRTAGTTGAADPDAMIDMVRRLGPANYYALVIGNSNYTHMEKLKTPTNDARDIAALLQSRYQFKVKLLIDATYDQIAAAVDEYHRTLTDSDRLLIYYAGHGGSKNLPPEVAYWAGVDTNPDSVTSWLSASVVADWIKQIKARHILVVADSCFSSAITHPVTTIVAHSEDERGTSILWRHSSRMVLTSGMNEPVADGNAPDKSHSIFAYQFISVLRENSILLSGENLALEISNRMAAAKAQGSVKETPTYSNLQDPEDKGGDFFFVPTQRPVQVASVM
jgi:Caspase domain/Sel1 repeat